MGQSFAQIQDKYMSDPPAVVVKEKNPKRVAAGKKLGERNKMYKEHFEKTREAPSEEKPASTVVEKTSNTNYYFVGVVVLVVGGIVYYYQSRSKSASRPTPQPKAPTPPPPPKPNRTINM